MVAAGARKRLDAALRGAKKLFLDTSVVIAYLKGNEPASPIAALVLDEYVRSGRFSASISVLTLMELLVQPLRVKRDIDTVLDFARYFPNLDIVPVNEGDALAGANVRAQYNLKTPDAVIVGTALRCGADTCVVTNDSSWKGVAEISVCALDTILASP